VGLTPNQRLKVTEDIQRILREKPNATQEEIFERLNVAYTAVCLADVKAVLEAVKRENR
jgi:arginine repressor